MVAAGIIHGRAPPFELAAQLGPAEAHVGRRGELAGGLARLLRRVAAGEQDDDVAITFLLHVEGEFAEDGGKSLASLVAQVGGAGPPSSLLTAVVNAVRTVPTAARVGSGDG